jgi:hypothetical protein
MIISTVLVSSNLNQDYYLSFPIVHKLLARQNIRCVLILVTYDSYLPSELGEYQSDIILYNVDKKMGEHYPVFVAQNIRLLWCGIMDSEIGENAIMISDVDMHILDISYFSKKVENVDNKYFVNCGLLPDRLSNDEYYMCYNIATPTIWREIFKVTTKEEVDKKLWEWWEKVDYSFDNKYRSKCRGFHHDQQQLFKHLENYNYKLIFNKDFHRLEGSFTISKYIDMLNTNNYTDLIPLKPYSRYANVYNIVYNKTIFSK